MLNIRAQLFKTKYAISLCIVKTLIIKYGKYANIFAEKMWVAFAKATRIFFSKNICELNIVLTRTVNILTTNQLIKLTMLWTTGPRSFYCSNDILLYFLKINSKGYSAAADDILMNITTHVSWRNEKLSLPIGW